MILKILFWSLVIICVYAYFGYPVILFLTSLFRKKPVIRDENFAPRVTFIIAAYNEEGVIGKKINNINSQNYSLDKVEIIVASDGSSDSTEDIVKEFADKDQSVKLLKLPRSGKANALNQAAKIATGDVLIFTDANAMLGINSVKMLVSSFYDPEVGCVAGNQHYSQSEKTSGASLGETLYWRYDRWLKDLETQVGNAVSADGALYAIRRKLFVPIKDPSATDDFSISTQVVLQGYRLVYDSRAVVVEATSGNSSREFTRKARIINRGLRSLFGLGSYLLPWIGGFYSIQLISHKLLRRFVPILLPSLFALNILLWKSGRFYFVLLVLQLVVYGMGLLGFVLRDTNWGRKRLFYIPYYFCQANVAGILGLYWFFKGQQISNWQPHREDI